jgi:hypothetical protein
MTDFRSCLEWISDTCPKLNVFSGLHRNRSITSGAVFATILGSVGDEEATGVVEELNLVPGPANSFAGQRVSVINFNH